jgi:hypothetical protein
MRLRFCSLEITHKLREIAIIVKQQCNTMAVSDPGSQVALPIIVLTRDKPEFLTRSSVEKLSLGPSVCETQRELPANQVSG